MDSLSLVHYYLDHVVGKEPFRLNIMGIYEIDLPIPQYIQTSYQLLSSLMSSQRGGRL